MIAVATAAQTRAAEKIVFANGVSPIELMGLVGDFIAERLSVYKNVLIVCGRGNNGGDGYATAIKLKEKGIAVTLLTMSDAGTESSSFYNNKCAEIGVKCIYRYRYVNFSDYDAILDCLYGIGFHGSFSEEEKELVTLINASKAVVISADVPSGLCSDNGIANVAVKADEVYTVGCSKFGLYLNSGKDYAKTITVIPLNFPYDNMSYLIEPEDCAEFLAERNNDSYKGVYGYIAIFGGSKNYSGAAKLAALASASMYSGSGVVRLAVPSPVINWIAPTIVETTLFDENDYINVLHGVASVGIGCGWGREEDRTNLLNKILQHCNCPIVLDADGLYAWKKLGCPAYENLIITPHYSEMAYLCDISVAEIRSDPVGFSRLFSNNNHCITVLKGPSTVITDGSNVFITNRGCAGMATAGSGDVLLGIITSVVGQKFKSILKSVAYATVLNGVSGEIAQNNFTDIGMTSMDTVQSIRPAIKFLRNYCGIN